jgi:D-alanine transfer protein
VERAGKTGMPHLFAGLITCGVTAAALLIGRFIAVHLEQRTVTAFAPELFPLKNQGLAFQRAAAHTAEVLPLYGGSELRIPPIPQSASNFFRTAPTGFQVSPIGKGGAASLIMLQKLGALGREFQGRKVAISISSVYFFDQKEPVTRYQYDGNFSIFAASQLTFGGALDLALKRDIAVRLLDFPHMLEKSAIVEFALRRLASDKWLDKLIFYLVWPLGKIENAIFDLQDHFAALSYILRAEKSAPALHRQILDWPGLIAKADEAEVRAEDEKAAPVQQSHAQVKPGSRDAWFRTRMNEAREWGDFELLLRTLTEIHARPLLISMPIHGAFYDANGISPSARQDYYDKIQTVARRYHFALVEFQEHDEDILFFDRRGSPRRHTHLSAKGWLFYNHVLDDFFHDRFSPD